MLIPLAILFALAAMGVFVASLVAALGERKVKKQAPLEPLLSSKTSPVSSGPDEAQTPAVTPPVSPVAPAPVRPPVSPALWPPAPSSHYDNETTQLQDKLDTSLKETERFSADNNRLRDEVLALNESVTALQAKLDRASVAVKQVFELEKKVTAQEASVGPFKEQLAAAQGEVEKLKAAADTLAKQNEAYKTQESGLHEELDKLKAENARLSKDFDELMKKAQDDHQSAPAQEVPAQAALIAQLQQELEALKKSSDSSGRENEAYKAEAAIQQEEIEALKSACARIQEELDEKNKVIEGMEQSANPAQDDSEALQAKIEGYNKEIIKLNEVISGLKQKEDLAGLISKEEYDQVKQQIGQKEALLLKLKTELESVLPQYQALQADFAQEKAREAELGHALEDMTARVEELKKQAPNRFPAEIAYLKKKLDLSEETSDKDVLVKAIESFEDSLVKVQELEKKLKVSIESSQQRAPGGTVPEDEYMKIKQKLEAAEKILRLIHGAG